MSREDPTGRSQGLGKPKFFLMYYFFKSVSAEKLPGPRWTGEGPLEPVSELVSLETVAQKTHKRCRWDAVGVSTGYCLCGVTAWAEAICQEGHPARARAHRVAPAQAQRQALQAGLAVGQPAPAQLGQHGEGTAVTRLETQAPMQSSAAPSPPRPPRSARPEPGWSPGWSAKASGAAAGPSGEAPHLGQHVAAVPRHSELLLVERGDVGAAQHRAGPRARRLLAGPAASRAGAESREAPRACWAPGTASTQLAGRQRSRPGLPASLQRLEPLGPSPESRWPLPQAPGGSRPVAPGHSPQGASQERPSQGGSREQRAGPGALPVGAACGVAGPWSVGGPIVHAGAPGYGDAARLADVVQHHPCRDRQAVWHVPHCLLRGRGERRGPCPPQACPRGLLGPRGHGTPQGLRPGTRDASV